MTIPMPIEKSPTAAETPVPLRPGMSDDERSDAIREGLKRIAKDAERLRASLAELLSEVSVRRYWERWGYRSFRDYVEAECSLKLRSAQALISTFGRFRRSAYRPSGYALWNGPRPSWRPAS